ncbi:hypothetical protein EV644_11665 [Kribbella orskensis]|uniref:Uncharacterized protein n=1 Tax=Kribbella orskensis TaxID=2512216 RepID=A0ABY2BD44_9ACTN|nr:hypothetical protein EV642_11765 [Kribbella sp. VKM Ac-2500]TCO16694.1 hypothetical protein EV644_11665 [Kribbella orskensis]
MRTGRRERPGLADRRPVDVSGGGCGGLGHQIGTSDSLFLVRVVAEVPGVGCLPGWCVGRLLPVLRYARGSRGRVFAPRSGGCGDSRVGAGGLLDHWRVVRPLAGLLAGWAGVGRRRVARVGVRWRVVRWLAACEAPVAEQPVIGRPIAGLGVDGVRWWGHRDFGHRVGTWGACCTITDGPSSVGINLSIWSKSQPQWGKRSTSAGKVVACRCGQRGPNAFATGSRGPHLLSEVPARCSNPSQALARADTWAGAMAGGWVARTASTHQPRPNPWRAPGDPRPTRWRARLVTSDA